MPCDDKPGVVVTVQIEGMCDSHAKELTTLIEKSADFVIKGYMAMLGGRAKRVPIVENPGETQH